MPSMMIPIPSVQGNITTENTTKSATRNKYANITTSTPLTCSQRLHLGTRVPVEDPSLKGVKKVNVRVGNDDVQTIDVNKIRTSQKNNISKKFLESFFKIPFR
eukprot:8469379-Ditylum_brightwellii.AAC.2